MPSSVRRLRFNPAAPDFNANLYTILAQLRTEQPLLKMGQTWVLSCYHDISAALKNPGLRCSGIPEQLHEKLDRQSLCLSPSLRALLFGIVLFEDGEVHRQHRQVLQSLFTGNAWQQLSVLIAHEADVLVSQAFQEVYFDGVRDIAAPLWEKVFAHWLNLPDRQQQVVREEKNAIRLLLDPSALDQSQLTRLILALENLEKTFEQLAQAHLAGYDSLFFHSLLQGYGGDTDALLRRFSTDCVTLLIGGSETSEALIGNQLHLMANRPDIQRSVQAENVKIRDVVLETMRFESPLQMARRKVDHATEIRGRQLMPGDNVLLCLGSANRDEILFEAADEFIPGRKNSHRNLGFGTGSHQCIGQVLAQFQAERVLRAMTAHGFFMPTGEATWSRRSLILRTLDCLPLHFIQEE